MANELLFIIPLIVFIAAFCRAAFGFGDALIAMPLLALFIDIRLATPLVALLATSSALIILLSDWRSANLRVSLRLIGAAILGTPVGLLMLKDLPEDIMKAVLGLLVMGFGVYNLLRPALKPIRDNAIYAYAAGFLAGILGGAYNTNGPPVVIYGKLRGWNPRHFRATLQGFFLPAGLFILLGHAFAGLWNARVFQFYSMALPVALGALWLGSRVNHRISGPLFDRLLNVILVIIAVGLLYRVFFI